SATVAVSFENSPAELIGERGDGFKHMLLLMNNARVGVGFESLGLCEAARRMATAYAAERPSMGKTIDRHEMIADYLEGMQTDCQAIRAMCMDAGWHEEMAQKLGLLIRYRPPGEAAELKKLEKQLKRHQASSRAITPLLKFYAAEKAVDMARLNIQIHGGVGYTKEYGAEKLLRDAMVMPIYEGTTQIQALMAMKDALVGVIKNPKRFVQTMAKARMRSLRGNALSRRVARIRYTACQAIQFLMTRLASSKFNEVRHQPITEWGAAMGDFDPKRDFAMAMLHAERLTHLLTDAAIAEILYKQVQAHPDRQDVLIRFLEKAEPRCRYRYDEITTTGLRLLEKLNQEGAGSEAQAAK
ncbi:MAG: hypothetical protein GWP91_10370, partial [Rhodobacterales bacterium]|nr:hypothetical protein [Rhodobacterales bacterium]